MDIDLTQPDFAYLFGFLQTDGHLSHEGRLSIELKASDEGVLRKLQQLFSVYTSVSHRTRDTNFKKDSESVVLRVYDFDTRKTLEKLGLPVGRKSDIIGLPTLAYSERDYFRGVIDGDGSVGFTEVGFPFMSLPTKSLALATAFADLIFRFTGKRRTLKPNKRDKLYNLMVQGEEAQTLARVLYEGARIALDRKAHSAAEILRWTRPDTSRKVTWAKTPWTTEEDQVVRTHSISDAVRILQRTEKSVSVRAWRLKNRQKVSHDPKYVREKTLRG